MEWIQIQQNQTLSTLTCTCNCEYRYNKTKRCTLNTFGITDLEWIQIQQNQTLSTLNTCTGYNWFGVNTDTTKPNVKYIKYMYWV